jgi:hypothetical protein
MGNVFREHLSLKPSESFRRNCYLAASTPGPEDIESRHALGVDNILWGNDLPHPEGSYPFTRYWIRERFRDVEESQARRMLGLSAAALYRVEQKALADLVQRIGPTHAEIYSDVALPSPVG